MIKMLLIKKKWLNIIISLALLLLITYLDLITGNVIVSLFYLVPILIITFALVYFFLVKVLPQQNLSALCLFAPAFFSFLSNKD